MVASKQKYLKKGHAVGSGQELLMFFSAAALCSEPRLPDMTRSILPTYLVS